MNARNQISHWLLRTSIFAVLFASLAGSALAQSSDLVTVALSEPGSQAELEVSLVLGSISVTTHDADEIVVMTSGGRGIVSNEPRSDGLRRIPNASFGLTVTEENNVVTVSAGRPGPGTDLRIRVPPNTSVRAKTVSGGQIAVRGVTGEHELSNVNGEIIALDIAGSLVANTTNGDVRVTFKELTPEKAMSFSSFNGDVEVSFPPDLQADLVISGGRGDVLTEFDFNLEQSQPSVEESGGGGRYRVRIEREVRATVGGGGPEMYFKTFNGDIVIRDNVEDE